MKKHELNEGKLAGNVRWVKSWVEQGLSRKEAHKKAKIYTIHPNTVDDLYNQAEKTNEGWSELPPINKEKYQSRKGLEGPIQTKSGKTVYYDPKAGKYYDPDTDMYMSYDEWRALDEGWCGVCGQDVCVCPPGAVSESVDALKQIVADKSAAKVHGVLVDMFTASAIMKVYDAVNDKNKASIEQMLDSKAGLMKMADFAMKQINEWGGDDQYEATERAIENALSIFDDMLDKGEDELRARAEAHDYLKGELGDLGVTHGDLESKKYHGELEQEIIQIMNRRDKGMREGCSPHKKGTAKYKKHMAAKHAAMGEGTLSERSEFEKYRNMRIVYDPETLEIKKVYPMTNRLQSQQDADKLGLVATDGHKYLELRRDMKSIKESVADEAAHMERDHEVQMARSDLYKIANYAVKLHKMLKNVSEEQGIQGWMQAKITKAADYMSSVAHTLEYDMMAETLVSEQLDASKYHCKDCGCQMHNCKPDCDCEHDSHDETGSWWVDANGNGVADAFESVKETTSAGGVAAVAMPMGKTKKKK